MYKFFLAGLRFATQKRSLIINRRFQFLKLRRDKAAAAIWKHVVLQLPLQTSTKLRHHSIAIAQQRNVKIHMLDRRFTDVDLRRRLLNESNDLAHWRYFERRSNAYQQVASL